MKVVIMNSYGTNWLALKKILFRFMFCYFIIYIFQLPSKTFYHDSVLWAGKNIFNAGEVTSKISGSGDTTYNYIQVYIILLLTTGFTILWSLFDFKKLSNEKLKYFFNIFIRYYLAFALLSYGFCKVIKTQFPFPGLDVMLEPYGESSPMALVWTFMGYSKGYNFFTGSAEVLGGLLLFFPRTVTLGSIISIGVMSNVFMLNMCYDIPVKLYSFFLLLIAFILLSNDLKRFLNFFIFNKPVEAIDYKPPFKNKNFNRLAIGLKSLIICFMIFTNINSQIDREKKFGDLKEKPPLYGIYDVESFNINNKELPPLLTDKIRWNKLVIDWDEVATIKMMDNTSKYCTFIPMTSQKKIKFKINKNNESETILTYQETGNNQLIIKGKIAKDNLIIRLKRFDLKKFNLVSRGFNWINEYPFNR